MRTFGISNWISIRLKDCDAERLKTEYQKLVQGLRDANIARETDVILANPGTAMLSLEKIQIPRGRGALLKINADR